MTAFASVFDFLTPAERADVGNRTCGLDVSMGFQRAIDTTVRDSTNALNTLLVPVGTYRIDHTLYCNGPLNIVGAGQGSTTFPYTQPPSLLAWRGSGNPMFVFGANGHDVFAGGGIVNLAFDGNNIATECLRIIDCVRFEFRNLYAVDATARIYALMGTANHAYPTGYGVFQNIWAAANFTGSNHADGLWVGTTNPGHPTINFDGVAMCTLIDCNFQTDQGAPVHIADRGDNFVWIRCTTGHQNNPTSPGTLFSGETATSVVSTHTWIDHTGDFTFRHLGTGQGQRIINLNMADTSGPALADPRNMIGGAGATEVTADSNIGYMWGQNKTLGYRQTIKHDAMVFMRWDEANNLLHTGDGTWLTSVTRAGRIENGRAPGGMVRLVTGNQAGDYAVLSDGASLLSPRYRPHGIATVTPGAITAVRYRIGWLDSLADPPANGIYVETDTGIAWAGWRFVCRRNGVETAVNSAYPFNVPGAFYQLRIELTDNPQPTANFFMRTQAFQFPEAKSLADNVPTVPLAWCYQVITLDGSSKTLAVFDHKRGFDTEE